MSLIPALAEELEVRNGRLVMRGAHAVHNVSIIASAKHLPPDVARTASQLYFQLYCRTRPSTPILPDRTIKRDFLLALERANQAHGRLSSGWRKTGANDLGDLIVMRGPEKLTVHARAFLPTNGDDGSLRLEAGSDRVQKTFYYCFSDDEGRSTGPPWRYYFNISRYGATKLVEAVTGELRRNGIPYTFKILADPPAYLRADAGVLYIDPQFERAAEESLATIWRRVAPWLIDEVPLFTQPLARGLGKAQSPTERGESFGSHRCTALANGLHNADGQTAAGRAQEIHRAFLRAGIDPDRPSHSLTVLA